jgi:hypothetical protein
LVFSSHFLHNFFVLDHNNKIDNSNCLDNYGFVQDNEQSLARFEPILFFCLTEELIQSERHNLSSIFSLQYRRFITGHLTSTQVDANLDEFYYIFYISHELPSHMENNPRIKFYPLSLSQNNEDPMWNIKMKERLIGKLLHDLGMFYSEHQKMNLSNEQHDQRIAKRLTTKAAKCYELLAIETEKTIQRYNQID